MYFIATRRGFVAENENGKFRTTFNIREAKPFESFEEAEKVAEKITSRYFAILKGAL